MAATVGGHVAVLVTLQFPAALVIPLTHLSVLDAVHTHAFLCKQKEQPSATIHIYVMFTFQYHQE